MSYKMTEKLLGIPRDVLKEMDIEDIENKINEMRKERIEHPGHLPSIDPFFRYPIVTQTDYENLGIN